MQRLQADWSVEACSLQADWRISGSSVQRLQADWSVERAALAGGLVGEALQRFAGGLAGLACSASTWTGQPNVTPRLQADWPSKHTGSVAGGLLAVQLQADCSVERASFSGRTGRPSMQ